MPTSNSETAPLDSAKQSSITDTVTGTSLKAFAQNLEILTRCFRCHSTIPNDEEWANFCQVIRFEVGPSQIVGGMLCHLCVHSWVEWRS